MRRTDREVKSKERITEILNQTKYLHLGLIDQGKPYVVSMHYGYTLENDALVFYVHSAREGRKIQIIEEEPACFVELETMVEDISGGEIPCRYGSTFASIMAEGHAEILHDPEEKIRGLKCLMKHQTGRDFELNEQMVSSVHVIRISCTSWSAKERKA